MSCQGMRILTWTVENIGLVLTHEYGNSRLNLDEKKTVVCQARSRSNLLGPAEVNEINGGETELTHHTCYAEGTIDEYN